MKLSPTLFILFIFIQSVMTTACPETTPIDAEKRQQTIGHKCKPLYMAVKNGKINAVKKLIKAKSQKNQLTCIKYALRQTNAYGGKNQFQAFRYLVEKLIAMKLPDQQGVLTKLLQDRAIFNFSIEPKYTEYLLSVGALPNTSDEYGGLSVASALFAVYDIGDCKTPSLLINASSSEMLTYQNKDGETALMQAITKGSPCFDELKLLAKKASGINLVDKHED